MSNRINDVLKTLALTGSAKREDVVRSIIESLLIDQKINVLKLQDVISQKYLITIHESELQACIVANHDHFKVESGCYYMEDEHIQTVINEQKEQDKSRLERFHEFASIIDDLSPMQLSPDQKELLWQIFTDYVYECFYLFGENTVAMFDQSAQLEEISSKTPRHVLNEKLQQVPGELCELFEIFVSEFPTKVSPSIVEYLDKLSDRVSSFFSLGLSKELHEEIVNLNVFDWTIFLDTNILYTLLGLDSHPLQRATVDLVNLINENKSNVKLRYIPRTLVELKERKKRLENSIINTNFQEPHLSVLVKSGKLDSFQKTYYEKKLKTGNQPHPADRIQYAVDSLKELNITLYNSSFKSLGTPENYIDLKCADFEEYQKFLNDIRTEKGWDARPIKLHSNAEHDIFLREAVLSLRNKNNNRLSDVKFFGLTLDKTLVKFDKYDSTKRGFQIIIPTFFHPQFLLSRLLKLFPVQTDNYKRAFLSAISSPTFDSQNGQEVYSMTVQKSVDYFKNLGISDEKVMLGCVTDDIFLDRFSELEDSDELKPFVTSEIEKKIQQLNEKYDDLKLESENTEKELSGEKTKSKKLREELGRLKRNITIVKNDLDVYKGELNKLLEVKTSSIAAGQFTIEDSKKFNKLEKKIANLNSSLKGKNDLIADERIKVWKRQPIIGLVISALIIIGPILLLLARYNWKLEQLVKSFDFAGVNLLLIGISTVAILIHTLFIREASKRYQNHEYVETKKKQLYEDLSEIE